MMRECLEHSQPAVQPSTTSGAPDIQQGFLVRVAEGGDV